MTRPERGLARSSLVYGIGTSATQVAYVAILPILTRILSPADFGVLDFLVTLNGLLAVVALLGMNSALFYFFSRTADRDERRRIAGTAVLAAGSTGVGLAIAGMVLSGSLAGPLLGEAADVPALAAAFAWVPASLLTTLSLDLLRLEHRPRAYSAVAVGRAVLATGLGVLAAGPAGLGVAGLIGAQAGVAFGAAAVALWLARASWTLESGGRIRRLRAMLAFGLPLVPAGIGLWVIEYSDRFLLIQLAGAEQAGIYALASRGAAVVTLAVFAFEAAWWPHAFAIADDPDHRDEFARTFAAVGAVLLVLATFLALFAREALLLIATPAYADAAPLVGILALAAVAYGLTPVVGAAVQLARRTRVYAWIPLSCAALNVVLNLVLIPRFGTVGAAAATVAAFATFLGLVHREAVRAYAIAVPIGRLGLALVPVMAGMALGTWLDSTATPGAWVVALLAAKAVVLLGVAGLVAAALLPSARSGGVPA